MKGHHLEVFIISLRSSTERRAKIQQELEALGLSFRFIDGIDLRNTDISQHPDYDGQRRRIFFGRDLEPGELGCLLSHREAYRKIVNEGIPHALVLEDDARLEDDLPHVLESIIESPIEWDMIRFIDKKKVYRRKCRRIGMLDSKHELARLPTNSGGAYGYLLNHLAATRLLELMQHNWLQSDVLHSRNWLTGLATYIVRPSPVTHSVDDDDSTIGTSRFEKRIQLSGWLRIAHPPARFLMQTHDKLAKRWHYLATLPRDLRQRRRISKKDKGGGQ